jgi:UV DNA damage endonuclease
MRAPTTTLRLGLCCTFLQEPIRFRTTTASSIAKLPRRQALSRLSALCQGNASALRAALEFCREHGIGCFRINSQILPLRTHPAVGYRVEDLPDGRTIVEAFRDCGAFAARNHLRLTFHPDQFVVLSSPQPQVLRSSLAELEYQGEVAEWVGADVINIHAGGTYGDPMAALDRFRRSLDRLSPMVRTRLTVENDDKSYAPADLLPFCRAEGIPLVYDVHHHRCHPDGLSEPAATKQAIATWDREPLFHISSPLEGWAGARPERHHHFIDAKDVPPCWRGLRATVEVEAKAKELAVLRLLVQLRARRSS